MNERDRRLIAYWKDHPRKSLRDTGEEFDLSYERVRQILNEHDVPVEKYSPGNDPYQYLDKEDIEPHAKRFIQSTQRLPTTREWDNFSSANDEVPSTAWVYRHYESWDDFLLTVGVEYHTRCRCHERIHSTSDRELIDELKRLAEELGRAPTYTEVHNDEKLPAWTECYKRLGRLSDLWDVLGIPYEYENQARYQNFTYSNNDIMDYLIEAYEEVGRDLSISMFGKGGRFEGTGPSINTFRRRLSGCRYSIIGLVERYKDLNDVIDWDESKYFMYHFHGIEELNTDIYPEFVKRQPGAEQ